jgi:3-hydroxybutyrate dehydrogenase
MNMEVLERVDRYGKVALVTGSTSAIGLGVARALAEAGAEIVSTASAELRTSARHRRRSSGNFGSGRSTSALTCSKPGEIADLVAKAFDGFGRLDIFVNNAGIQHVARIDELPIEKWDAILAINLSSAFHTTRLALPMMRQNGFGRIVNIASAHGLVGSPFKSAYVAAKHGIVGLTKVTALGTAEERITCNAICPGYVYTPPVAAQIDGQAKTYNIPREKVIRDVLRAQQPNKRFALLKSSAPSPCLWRARRRPPSQGLRWRSTAVGPH